MKSISYAIPFKDEIAELEKLLGVLTKFASPDDEVVILSSPDNPLNPGLMILMKTLYGRFKRAILPFRKFDHDFSAHKNFLNAQCTGDYIFSIDADEYPSDFLLQYLRPMLESNDGIDLILVPRVNIVDGITSRHIAQWGWSVGKMNNMIGEKEIDTESEEYNFLKKGGFIIEENPL